MRLYNTNSVFNQGGVYHVHENSPYERPALVVLLCLLMFSVTAMTMEVFFSGWQVKHICLRT